MDTIPNLANENPDRMHTSSSLNPLKPDVSVEVKEGGPLHEISYLKKFIFRCYRINQQLIQDLSNTNSKNFSTIIDRFKNKNAALFEKMDTFEPLPPLTISTLESSLLNKIDNQIEQITSESVTVLKIMEASHQSIEKFTQNLEKVHSKIRSEISNTLDNLQPVTIIIRQEGVQVTKENSQFLISDPTENQTVTYLQESKEPTELLQNITKIQDTLLLALEGTEEHSSEKVIKSDQQFDIMWQEIHEGVVQGKESEISHKQKINLLQHTLKNEGSQVQNLNQEIQELNDIIDNLRLEKEDNIQLRFDLETKLKMQRLEYWNEIEKLRKKQVIELEKKYTIIEILETKLEYYEIEEEENSRLEGYSEMEQRERPILLESMEGLNSRVLTPMKKNREAKEEYLQEEQLASVCMENIEIREKIVDERHTKSMIKTTSKEQIQRVFMEENEEIITNLQYDGKVVTNQTRNSKAVVKEKASRNSGTAYVQLKVESPRHVLTQQHLNSSRSPNKNRYRNMKQGTRTSHKASPKSRNRSPFNRTADQRNSKTPQKSTTNKRKKGATSSPLVSDSTRLKISAFFNKPVRHYRPVILTNKTDILVKSRTQKSPNSTPNRKNNQRSSYIMKNDLKVSFDHILNSEDKGSMVSSIKKTLQQMIKLKSGSHIFIGRRDKIFLLQLQLRVLLQYLGKRGITSFMIHCSQNLMNSWEPFFGSNDPSIDASTFNIDQSLYNLFGEITDKLEDYLQNDEFFCQVEFFEEQENSGPPTKLSYVGIQPPDISLTTREDQPKEVGGQAQFWTLKRLSEMIQDNFRADRREVLNQIFENLRKSITILVVNFGHFPNEVELNIGLLKMSIYLKRQEQKRGILTSKPKNRLPQPASPVVFEGVSKNKMIDDSFEARINRVSSHVRNICKYLNQGTQFSYSQL